MDLEISSKPGNIFSTIIEEVLIPAAELLGTLKYFFHRVVFGYICTTIRGDIVDRPTRLALLEYIRRRNTDRKCLVIKQLHSDMSVMSKFLTKCVCYML